MVSTGWLLHAQQASAFPFGERRARGELSSQPDRPDFNPRFHRIARSKEFGHLWQTCGAPIEKPMLLAPWSPCLRLLLLGLLSPDKRLLATARHQDLNCAPRVACHTERRVSSRWSLRSDLLLIVSAQHQAHNPKHQHALTALLRRDSFFAFARCRYSSLRVARFQEF